MPPPTELVVFLSHLRVTRCKDATVEAAITCPELGTLTAELA